MPDAKVLTEAITSGADWFITHDKKHFLNKKSTINLPIRIGTPGDFIQYLQFHFIN